MKRFLLFYGDTYYPSRAWNDFRGSFDTAEEARAAIPGNDANGWGKPDWAQIVDTVDGACEEINL